MDTSYWTSLNLKHKIEPTQKLFFNKYLCRVQYYCPGSAYLRDYSSRWWGHPEEFLNYKIETDRNRNHLGSWYTPRKAIIEDIILPQLESTRLIISNNQVKNRIEEPFVSLYTEKESELFDIVSELSLCIDRIEHINLPLTAQVQQDLENNVIYMKRGVGYQYKVTLKDRWEKDSIPGSIVKYLDNMGDQVKISKTVRETLEKNLISQCWFYTNDITFLSMIDLMYPNGVLKVQQIKTCK